MSDIAISVENISKRYRIGLKEELHDTLFGAMVSWAKAPFTSLQKLRRLSKFEEDDAEDIIWALKDVSFEVKTGEVIGIIGRNGAGKSTLLKILSFITEPTSGRAVINGRVSSLLEVGTGFHPELTGRENVYLNATILGMTKAEVDKKFDEIVAFSEVEKFIDTPVKRYSSGMKVRLAFSVAAHLEPEILVIDEVLSVGDAAFQKKCLGKMEDVSGEGRTVLFVSHNMTAVKSLCSRGICLKHGKIINDSDVNLVVESYLQDGEIGCKERIWREDDDSAPGNDAVRLHYVRLTPLGKDLEAVIDLETPLQLEIAFWNYMPDIELNTVAFITTIEGIIAFTMISPVQKYQPGLFRHTTTIPANFLNEGGYTVRIQITVDKSKALFRTDELLRFEVHDVARGMGWLGREPGIFRPKFEWDLAVIELT